MDSDRTNLLPAFSHSFGLLCHSLFSPFFHIEVRVNTNVDGFIHSSSCAPRMWHWLLQTSLSAFVRLEHVSTYCVSRLTNPPTQSD